MKRSVLVLNQRTRRQAQNAQLSLVKLGDKGAAEMIRRDNIERDKRAMRSATALPLVRSETSSSRRQAADPMDTSHISVPPNAILMLADCRPGNTILHYFPYSPQQPGYHRGAAMDEVFIKQPNGRYKPSTTDSPLGVEEENVARYDASGTQKGYLETLVGGNNAENLLLQYTPVHAGYPADGSQGYAAAQIATNESLYKLYQIALNRKLVLPQKQMQLVLHIRGHQRGRGGVFHALKENAHLLALVDVKDCTSDDARRKKLWTDYKPTEARRGARLPAPQKIPAIRGLD